MADTKNKIDFDSSLKRLESIVSKLENNDVEIRAGVSLKNLFLKKILK